MKIERPWLSDRNMRVLFSNVGSKDEKEFYVLMVYHKSRKGGFSKEISQDEVVKILKKYNPDYIYKVPDWF